jgi:hypothetical protein
MKTVWPAQRYHHQTIEKSLHHEPSKEQPIHSYQTHEDGLDEWFGSCMSSQLMDIYKIQTF